MSSGKTETLGLNQWKEEDLFLMEEFNADNRALDQAVGARALRLVKSWTLGTSSNTIALNLSDLGANLVDNGKLILRVNGYHNGSGALSVNLTMNGVTAADSYLACDRSQGAMLAQGASIPVGMLCSAGMSGYGGLEIELRGYYRGIQVSSAGMCWGGSSGAAYDWIGTPTQDSGVTWANLTEIALNLESSTALFVASTVVSLYCVKV